MKETNIKILTICATGLRYMSQHKVLALELIRENKVQRIIDMCIQGVNDVDQMISSNLTLTLLNLTFVDGKEGTIVEQGIINGFVSISHTFPEMTLLCARGLYNLTCVGA